MPLYLIYPIYTGLLALIVIFVIPKKEIRQLSVFGIFFGAVMDIGAIGLFMKLFKIASWINYGPFGVGGLAFFPPIAWTCYYILYFYMIPKYKPWNYIFAFAGAGYSVLFAIVLRKLGIFSPNYNEIISLSSVYMPWHMIVTWGYFRINGYSKVTNNRNNLFGLSPVPAKRLMHKKNGHASLQDEDKRNSEINKLKVIVLKTKEKRPSFWRRIKNMIKI